MAKIEYPETWGYHQQPMSWVVFSSTNSALMIRRLVICDNLRCWDLPFEAWVDSEDMDFIVQRPILIGSVVRLP